MSFVGSGHVAENLDPAGNHPIGGIFDPLVEFEGGLDGFAAQADRRFIFAVAKLDHVGVIVGWVLAQEDGAVVWKAEPKAGDHLAFGFFAHRFLQAFG
jgi:hypothetical protein